MSHAQHARAEDAGGIARVYHRELVPDAVLDGIDVDQRRARLENGDFTFVFEEHGIAGYCRIVLPSEVASPYVLPDRRHRGLGSALLTAALDELRSHAPHATLWVFKANHATRAFFARFGFAPDGTERVDAGTGLDEIHLRAEL